LQETTKAFQLDVLNAIISSKKSMRKSVLIWSFSFIILIFQKLCLFYFYFQIDAFTLIVLSLLCKNSFILTPQWISSTNCFCSIFNKIIHWIERNRLQYWL
jgi:hypothetical protein